MWARKPRSLRFAIEEWHAATRRHPSLGCGPKLGPIFAKTATGVVGNCVPGRPENQSLQVDELRLR